MARNRAVHVASRAILLARTRASFRLPDLKDEVELGVMPADSTFHLVPGQLEEGDWLSREHPEGRT